MKIWKLVAVPLALLGSQALAENWVTVAADPDGSHVEVDKDTVRRGDDGLVYYSDDSGDQSDAMAADCAKHLSYTLSMDLIIGKHLDNPNWRNDGKAVQQRIIWRGRAAIRLRERRMTRQTSSAQ